MGNQLKLVSKTRIYLDARALLDEILDMMPNFPRAYKFSVGAKMQELGIDLIEDMQQPTWTSTTGCTTSLYFRPNLKR